MKRFPVGPRLASLVAITIATLGLPLPSGAGEFNEPQGGLDVPEGGFNEPEGSVSADDIIVRIPLADVPDRLRDQIDPCAIDRLGAGDHAVFFLSAAERDALTAESIPHEVVATVREHMAQFAPRNTIARKPVPAFERVIGSPTIRTPAPPGIAGAPAFLLTFDEYHSLDEGVAFIHAIADAYPGISRVESIGETIEGRDIWAIVFTDNPGVVEPEEERILFTGVTHAREWATHEMALYMVQELATRYGSDTDVTHVVDNSEVWIVPVVNPDGYRYSWVTNRMWRKNRRQHGFGCDGVDINRNYEYRWGGEGSSGSECNETYRGSFPASEPETQAIQNLLTQQEFAIAVSYHTFGQLMLYPWGHTAQVTAQSYTSHRAIGKKYADLILESGGLRYLPGPGAYTIYIVSGDFNDYAYAARGALTFTPELRPRTSSLGGFLLAESEILPNNQENMVAALWMMRNVADAREVVNAESETLVSAPGVGDNLFSLPLTPINQHPEISLGLNPADELTVTTWLDDLEHNPPFWGEFGDDFEACGSGAGYVLEATDDSLDFVANLTSYKALPYVFEDGAEVMLSFVEPGLGIIGVPGSERPVPMETLRIFTRNVELVTPGANGTEEIVLQERTALRDMDAHQPWIDWTWEYVDAEGASRLSHPAGDGGVSRYLDPFKAYYFESFVSSFEFASSSEAVYLVAFPGTIDDCNENGVADSEEVSSGAASDLNSNGAPDLCESLADFDGDGDRDRRDFAALLDCTEGPDSDVVGECQVFDVDGDADVDLVDWGAFMILFTGDCAMEIVEQPDGGEHCPGESAKINITAQGENLRFQWYHRGIPIEGAESASLTLDDLTLASRGKYRVAVHNGCRRIFSEAAVIELPAAPQITSQPQDLAVCEGVSFELAVTAIGAEPLSYQWRRNGIEIEGGNDATLVVPTFEADLAGAYDCMVSDVCGTTRVSGVGTVSTLSPVFESHPQSGSFCEGENVFLIAGANSATSYQWYKDESVMPGEIGPLLSLYSVTSDDAGVYHSVATNTCGSTATGPATVEVTDCVSP